MVPNIYRGTEKPKRGESGATGQVKHGVEHDFTL